MALLVIFEYYYYSPLLLCRFLYLTIFFSFLFLSQAIVTPLSEHLLGWREIENSIAYCLIALEVSNITICLYFIIIDGLGE